MSHALLILILVSACCVIIGVVLVVIHGSRFARNQRARENEIEITGMLEERKAKKEMEATQE